MAETTQCTIYPDLFAPYPEGASEKEKKLVDDENEKRKPFFNAIRFLLINRFGFTGEVGEAPDRPAGVDVLAHLDLADRVYFISVTGLMLAENFTDPLLGKPEEALGPEDVVRENDAVFRRRTAAKPEAKAAGGLPQRAALNASRLFVEQMVSAVKEFQANQAMFNAVYRSLEKEGRGATAHHVQTVTVHARQLAEVTEQLIGQNADPSDPQLPHMVGDALSAVLGKTLQGRFSATDIDLPDLEEGSQADVISDNVRALSAVYFAAMLEDLKFFAVADKVVEQFMTGMVPVSRGTAGDAMYDYFKAAADRLTEVERRGIYARAFGLAQGSVDEMMPNREFTDLWIRFLSGVNLINRQALQERLVVTNEYVFKNARDLAVNLSLHGYGAAHFAAVELQKLVNDVKKMLSFADVLNAYGVRDYNQLIERVSTLYLGGAVNGVRQRTMATTGARIIQFLAEKSAVLSSPYDAQKVNFRAVDPEEVERVLHRRPNSEEQRVIDLVSNVDRWLAVNGTPDATVDKFAEPVAMTQQPTIPSMFNGAGGGNLDALRDAMSKVGNLAGAPKA